MDSYLSRNSRMKTEHSEDEEKEFIYATCNKERII